MTPVNFLGWEVHWLAAVGIVIFLVLAIGVILTSLIDSKVGRIDLEQIRGLAAIAGVVLAVSLTVLMCITQAPPAWVRVVLGVVAFALALIFASTNWTRSSLRLTALLAILLTGYIVVNIGRASLSAQDNIAARADIAATVRTVEQLQTYEQQQQDRAAEAKTAALTELSKTIEALKSVSIPTDPVRVSLEESARRIYAQLMSGGDEAALDAEVNLLNQLVPQVTQSDDVLALKAAVDTAVAAQQKPSITSVEDLNDALAEACAVVGLAPGSTIHPAGDPPPASAPKCPEAATDPAATDSLDVALATMRLRLALYREGVLGRAEDTAAVKVAREELASLQGNDAAPAEDQSFLDAIIAGGNSIVEELPGQGDPPVVLELLGWVLLAVVALGFWRIVERRSGQQQPGPVTIELTVAKSPRNAVEDPKAGPAGAADNKAVAAVGTDAEAQLAVFRSALLLNLTEPGAVPGSAALQSLTDLVELPGINKTWITPIVTALRAALSPTVGYRAAGEVVPPENHGGEWNTLVRVFDLANGRQIDVNTFMAKSDVQSCRAAGYWAATVILSRSSRIPSWARWDIGTASALAAYRDSEHDEATTELETAVALAPSSGVLLQTLASRYDLAGEHLKALSISARSVAAHPRYPVARYRLAASIGILAANSKAAGPGKPEGLWEKTTLADRERLCGQLRRAFNAVGINETTELDSLATKVSSPGAATVFEDLVEKLYSVLRRDTSFWSFPARALRRAERDSWWPAGVAKFGKSGPRRRARQLVLSAMLQHPTQTSKGSQQKKDEKKAKEIQVWAGKPNSLWQLSYNLACYYSTHGDVQKALTWLETALERPASGQMAGKWLDVDPDLEQIRHTPQFSWVKSQLGSQ